MPLKKLAIICSHPIQYYAPWFRQIAMESGLEIKVFYLNDEHAVSRVDSGFKIPIQWDVPLLEGYDYEFVGKRGLWQTASALLSAVKKYDPEVVFLTGYNNLIYYRFIFGWDSVRIPLIFRGDSHRLFARRTPDEFLRHRFISFVFRRFSAFLYVGKSNYDYFCYHNVRPERLFFSPHAVDNERFLGQAVKANEDAFAWKKEAGIPPDYRVILYVGKFEEKKRLFDLLEAFRMADLSKVALLCVGSGEMEAALRECSRGVGDVYFAPFQNQTFMPRTYAAGDLFVLPSYGREETWGLSVNEAMCMAKAVIVSSHVGCAQDLVVPRKNGLVFPAGDVEALAHCLREAFSDSVDLVRWGLEGQKMIEHYHYVEATKGLVQALDFLARERGN